MNIHKLFTTWRSALGGKKNPSVQWYLQRRPTRIRRQTFFQEAVWAIWVAGKTDKIAKSLLNRAEREGGFSWEWQIIAQWSDVEIHSLIRRVHGPLSKPDAERRWLAIHAIAQWLAGFGTENTFREEVFRGKVKSMDLNENDVRRLVRRHLPRIRLASGQLMIRNMGGEEIKCDRWIKAFLCCTGLSYPQLCDYLRRQSIPLGYFDIVFWAYCQKFIRRVRRFERHVDQFMAGLDRCHETAAPEQI